MTLHYFCERCKKVSDYDGRDEDCARCEIPISEIYKCDKCLVLLKEDDVCIYEKGIECFEMCKPCLNKTN